MLLGLLKVMPQTGKALLIQELLEPVSIGLAAQMKVKTGLEKGFQARQRLLWVPI